MKKEKPLDQNLQYTYLISWLFVIISIFIIIINKDYYIPNKEISLPYNEKEVLLSDKKIDMQYKHDTKLYKQDSNYELALMQSENEEVFLETISSRINSWSCNWMENNCKGIAWDLSCYTWLPQAKNKELVTKWSAFETYYWDRSKKYNNYIPGFKKKITYWNGNVSNSKVLYQRYPVDSKFYNLYLSSYNKSVESKKRFEKYLRDYKRYMLHYKRLSEKYTCIGNKANKVLENSNISWSQYIEEWKIVAEKIENRQLSINTINWAEIINGIEAGMWSIEELITWHPKQEGQASLARRPKRQEWGTITQDREILWCSQNQSKNNMCNFEIENCTISKIKLRCSILYFGNERDAQNLIGKTIFWTGSIPNTDISLNHNLTINSLEKNSNGRYIIPWPFKALSDWDLNKIDKNYPQGNVPFNIALKIWDSTFNQAIESFSAISYIPAGTIDTIADNKIYRIGVVQVVQPGFDLYNHEVCLVKEHGMNNSDGYKIKSISSNCAEDYKIQPILPTQSWIQNVKWLRTYKIYDLLFSNSEYTEIPDVYWPSETTDMAKSGPFKVYSLLGIGKFWESLLARHWIEDIETNLGKNPKFDIEFLNPIEHEPLEFPNITPKVRTKIEKASLAKEYFSQITTNNNLNLSTFDFVVFLNYVGATSIPTFRWAFADIILRNSYVSIPLNTTIINNNQFNMIIHELGHQMFLNIDLYSGEGGIKYPQGIPEPGLSELPQKLECIMAQQFWDKIKESATPSIAWKPKRRPTSIEAYTTDTYTQEHYEIWLSKFHTSDPKNYVLCAESIVNLMNTIQNPKCPLGNYNSGKCKKIRAWTITNEPCSSLNYLSCKDPNLTTPEVERMYDR